MPEKVRKILATYFFVSFDAGSQTISKLKYLTVEIKDKNAIKDLFSRRT